MREITVPSSAVALRSDKPLTPAMVSAIWELASALDAARVTGEVDYFVCMEAATSQIYTILFVGSVRCV